MQDLVDFCGTEKFGTVLADPPWRFQNRTGKIAPEHVRLARYETMNTDEIVGLPVARVTAATAHLYLWVPNALLPDGLRVMAAWGFEYKTNIVWHKVRNELLPVSWTPRKVFYGTGGGRWNDGNLRESSSSRRSA